MLKSSAERLQQVTISVCVLTANRPQLLLRLLQALTSQLTADDEIVVLDTDPLDANAEIVSAVQCKNIRYRAEKFVPFDFATARNTLLKTAIRDAAVFIDDDATPFPGWLDQVRENLSAHHASGGVTVSSAELPAWWDPAINWCIGLSPPGTIIGEPGYYPDTCNMAARMAMWNVNPLCTIPRSGRELYATGREDADWWMERRRHGDDVVLSYRQAVVHEVHEDRLQWSYVMKRAQLDGQSSWLRRPDIETASAIPWDLAHTAGVTFDKFCTTPFSPRKWVNDYVWMNRQWGLFKSVWKSPADVRPRHRQLAKELTKATAFQCKIRVTGLAFKAVKYLNHQQDFPASAPATLFVSADCLLGDSILLRPHIQALASTFPSSEVIVSARASQLMGGLAENVKVIPSSDASAYTTARLQSVSAAFVPYFYGGDYTLWRKHLSHIGSTFNCDVGFSGRRDYIFARRLVEKNLELHEHENLAKLFRLWPLASVPQPDPPPLSEQALQWHEQLLAQHGVTAPYVVVQLGAGYASKEWPLENWLQFLKLITQQVTLPVFIIGSENWKDAGDTVAKETGGQCISLAEKTNLDQLMALIAKAQFFIGGCSGPKHLAMEYRVPTFTLYSATEPERWGASRDYELHAYITALPQKLTGMETQGLRDDHRPRLLSPNSVFEQALSHYQRVTHQG